MGTKALETLVRELQNTIVNNHTIMERRIDALEVTVSELLSIIKKEQAPLSAPPTRKSILSAPTNSHIEPTTTSMRAAPQRTLRTARINAAIGISMLGTAAAGTKKIGKENAVKCSATSGDDKKNTPVKMSDDQSSQNTKKVVTEEKHRTSCQSLVPETISSANKNETSGEPWQIATRRRRSKQQRPVIVGIGSNDNHELQAIERSKYIQAWHFKTETTTEQVLKFLNNIEESKYIVTKRDIKTNMHASFLIGMPENVYRKVTKPSAWPQGIRFSDWFFRSHTRRASVSEGDRDSAVANA